MENNENNKNINNIETENDYILDKIFFKKYRCIEKIGKGSFGFVYKGEYNNKYYALKFENKYSEKNILENEASLMIYLKGPNIPYIITYGSSGDFNILVMQLLGKNLQTLLSKKKYFSIKTVCILAFQMISVLEHIHKNNIIHRDIKPENFLMGIGENCIFLYLIDFGLSKSFNINSVTHYSPNKEGKKLTGTPRYASINALRALEQSKRDDLESLGYVLVYLLKGSLPWQDVTGKNRTERLKKILVQKIETSSTDLCSGLPNEFEQYMDYCKDLEFEEEPNYNMLKNLFLQVLSKENQKFDYIYDWSTPEEIEIAKSYIDSDYNIKFIQSNNIINYISKKNINNYENNITTEDREININNKENEDNNKIIIKNNNNNDNSDNKDKNEENKKKREEICCCIII